MLIEYELDVKATCPVDHKSDVYGCVIRTGRTIPAEEILAAVAGMRGRELFQEDLTRELHRALAAQVETVGWHSGVRTRVVVGEHP